MKQLTCEMCGSTDLLKQEGVFVCQICGCKYSVEEAKKMMVEGTVKVDKSDEIAALLKRVFNFLEEGEYEKVDEYCERILDIDPECAEAYLAQMLSDFGFTKIEDLGELSVPFCDYPLYKKIFKFADEPLKNILLKHTEQINYIIEHGLPENSNNKRPFIAPKCLIEDKERIVIPRGITSIKDYAFYKCSSLTDITIPDSVTSIGCSAFEGCWKLTKIEMPESVAYIGSNAFYRCSSLTNITIPETITHIGNEAFDGRYVKEINVLGKDLEKFLKSELVIRLNNVLSVSYQEPDLLFNNQLVDTVCISENIVEASKTAIYNTVFIKKIVIKNTVKRIEEDAFKNSDIKDVYYEGTIEEWLKICFDGYFTNPCGNLYIKGVLVKNLIIPSSTTKIGKFAFHGCKSIERVYIPGSVKTIGENAFSFTHLNELKLGEGIEQIEESAFTYCDFLREVVLPTSVKHIDSKAFDKDVKLTKTSPTEQWCKKHSLR